MTTRPTPQESEITWHIIYASGTVAHLLPFVVTLLRWSDCRFVLVGNGTGEDENQLLQEFAAREPRVTVRTLARLSHPAVLELLIGDTSGAYYAMLDSDIVVDGPFMPPLLAALAEADGVFSGAPLALSPADCMAIPGGMQLLGGHSRTDAGQVLGGTFCAILRRDALGRAIAESSVGLESASWCELSAANRRTLEAAQQRYGWYDTARVTYSLLLSQGRRFAWVELSTLYHLGGYTWRNRRRARSSEQRSGVQRLLQPGLRRRVAELRQKLVNRLCRHWYRWRYRPQGRKPNRRRFQVQVTGYFGTLIESCRTGGTPPEPPLSGSPTTDRLVARCSAAITAAWQGWHGGAHSSAERG